MAISTTNNGFKNGVGSDLMRVSGNDSLVTYTASTFSDKIDDVIQVKFKDPFRGTNFRTAYDPTATESTTTSGQRGFRQEIFLPATSQENYDILKHFRVKQIDGETGVVTGEGIPLRWVPPSSQGGDGVLFIKVLFHNSANPSYFNVENGVIFCNEAVEFSYGGKTFPGNVVSYGSSILSITSLSNVYKITSKEAYNSSSGTALCDGIRPGKGLYVSGQRVHLKTTDAVCSTTTTAIGTVISVSVDTASQKVSVFVEFDSSLDDVTGIDGFCQPCTTAAPTNKSFVLCTGDSNNQCTATCVIYGVDAIRKISTPSCGTVQKIVFADEFVTGGEFAPGEPGERNIYQWNYNFCGNHPSNGGTLHIPKQDDSLAKITGEYLHWDPQNKILYVMCPDSIMKVEYGNVYQKRANESLVRRGSGIASNSNFDRKTGSFVNIRNYPGILTYVPGSEYVQNWETGGELLVQRTASSTTTGYNPNFEYVVGETVIQALTENEDKIVTEYAAGTVVNWEPNKTALSRVPSVLTIKKLDIGTDDPKDFNSNNPLITRTKQLCRFRYGAGIAPPTGGSLLTNSKRNILPLRVFQTTPATGTTQTNWYDFSSDYVVQASVLNETLTDPLTEATPVISIGTIAKGSSIGSTRIKAIESDSGNEYKLSLMNTKIFYPEPVSFKDVTGIGISVPGEDPVASDNILVTYNSIVKTINVTQDLVSDKYVTRIKNPTSDKQIVPLPGPDIIENVVSGSANFANNEILIQKLYNAMFASNKIRIEVNQQNSSFVQNAEFPLYLSSSYSFVIDQNSGQTLNLIKITDLDTSSQEPTDNNTLYYDVIESGGNTTEVLFKKRSSSPTTDILFGCEVKCPVTSVIKNKTQKQFSESVKLRYQSSGEFKGKWVGTLNQYDVESLISVFAVNGSNILTKNIKSYFGISKEVDDYVYSKSLIVLSSEGTKGNSNTNPALGPVTPVVPDFGVYQQDSINRDEYTVSVYVSGYSNEISTSAAGIILRESYKDFNNNVLSIKNIPFYKSKTDGAEYHPSILLDCRPLIGDNNLAGSTKFVVLPSSSTVNTTLQGYLPRNDILYLNKEGRFKFAYGIPSFTPKYPELPEFGMILYKIKKPSYIFSNEDLNLLYTDNRRYTMRDIGRLDKRIQQLESYSSLSLLEKNADSLLIEDANGNNRFKNGIIVDPFQNHKIGETSHPDYYVAVDAKQGCLRPVAVADNVAVVPTTNPEENKFIPVLNTNTGVQESGPIPVICPPLSTGLFIMPFTQTSFVVQPMATRAMSLTPFEVMNLEGVVRLLPREDDWVDTTTKPDLNVNLAGNNDAWDRIVDSLNASAAGPFEINYGNWTEISRQTTTDVDVNVQRGRNWERTTTTTTRDTTINEQRTATQEQLRTSTEQVSLGERVVDVSLIPYMREKLIRIAITGMKTNARIYPFFDGIDVSEYCYWYPTLDALDAAAASGVLNPANSFASSEIRKTTAQGNAFILFSLPASVFRTGDRKFTISDNPNNDFTRASTYATGTYSASGLSQIRESTVATVRNFSTENVEWSEDRALFSTNTTVDVKFRSWDPLAQTFVVNRELYPNGIFLSSIDLFFARKPDNSTNIPVEVQIRPVVNGFPDAYKIYPGAIASLHPSQVNVSDAPSANNAQSATRFTFENPVYLEPGEHAIVVKSTTFEYEAYIAEVGQNMLNTTQKVTQQPYIGTFFASSNASTWLPQPQFDMMMVLNKCEFPVNVNYTFVAKTQAADKEYRYETLNFSNAYQEFDVAKVSWGLNETNNVNGPYDPINANQDINYTSTKILPSGSSLYFKATARTTNKDVCPVINTERLSAIFVKNIVENNFSVQTNGELNPYANDNGEYRRSRYITKIVNLEEGFESSGFKLILAVNKPVGTKIQAFVKYQTAEQTEKFHQNSYVQLIPDMGVTAFDNYYTSTDSFVDVKFTLPTDAPAPFNKFAIKICLYSENAAYVPRVQDLRGIAVL